MLPYLIFPAILAGFVMAFYWVGYVMLKTTDPYQRVAILCTILATEVAALIFATLLLAPIVSQVLFIFALTKNLLWCNMNHRNIVHFQLDKD